MYRLKHEREATHNSPFWVDESGYSRRISGATMTLPAGTLTSIPVRLVVVHDELDLPVAALRIKVGGGLAGHNGLRSIKQHLHTDEFLRVRIGVGKPPSKERGANHVLSPVSKRDREEMAVTIERAADAVETILRDGVDAAMNTFNTTP